MGALFRRQTMQTGLSALGGAVKLGLFVSGLTLATLVARFATAHTPTAEARAVAQVHSPDGGQSAPPDLRGLVDAEGEAEAAPATVGARLARQLADLRAARGSERALRLSSLPPGLAETSNAFLPFSSDRNPPARPFVLKGSAADRNAALTCLTQAIYYEAGFEPVKGGEAVAQVVLNRMRHPIFPHSVCGVVYQGAALKTGCQFSFACDGSLARKPQSAAWERARGIARRALAGYVMKEVGGATHYHTQWILPWWRPTVTKVAQVGAHIFYRWPGTLGLPGAFNMRYAGHERAAATPVPKTLAGPDPVLTASLASSLRGGPASPIERLAALARAAKSKQSANPGPPPVGAVNIATESKPSAPPALRPAIGGTLAAKPDF